MNKFIIKLSYETCGSIGWFNTYLRILYSSFSHTKVNEEVKNNS